MGVITILEDGTISAANVTKENLMTFITLLLNTQAYLMEQTKEAEDELTETEDEQNE